MVNEDNKQNEEWENEIVVNRELIDECKVFWYYWVKEHKEEFDNIVRGRPQFGDVMESDKKV